MLYITYREELHAYELRNTLDLNIAYRTIDTRAIAEILPGEVRYIHRSEVIESNVISNVPIQWGNRRNDTAVLPQVSSSGAFAQSPAQWVDESATISVGTLNSLTGTFNSTWTGGRVSEYYEEMKSMIHSSTPEYVEKSGFNDFAKKEKQLTKKKA